MVSCAVFGEVNLVRRVVVETQEIESAFHHFLFVGGELGKAGLGVAFGKTVGLDPFNHHFGVVAVDEGVDEPAVLLGGIITIISTKRDDDLVDLRSAACPLRRLLGRFLGQRSWARASTNL
jgi:hypothetical protein